MTKADLLSVLEKSHQWEDKLPIRYINHSNSDCLYIEEIDFVLFKDHAMIRLRYEDCRLGTRIEVASFSEVKRRIENHDYEYDIICDTLTGLNVRIEL